MGASIKRVLITHAEPNSEESPYDGLVREWGLQVDFRNFVEIQGMSVNEFRKQNINPLDFSAIIFTGTHPIDHFFRLCTELRIEMPADMKYFCTSELAAKYLQKYIVIRKRKLYAGHRSMTDLLELLKKKPKETYLYPCGDQPRHDLLSFLDQKNYTYTVGKVYESVPCDLSDLQPPDYDLICFFSPKSINALFENFPNFEQGRTQVAVFGKTTTEAAEAAGLRIDIQVPTPELPSMAMAIEQHLRQSK